jgi:hypothetical protein
MMLVRDVFQAKYGKGNELVALFKEGYRTWGEKINTRILSDASGSFFTVITEMEIEKFSAWEKSLSDILSHPDFGDWFARMEPLVVSGSREFYNIE